MNRAALCKKVALFFLLVSLLVTGNSMVRLYSVTTDHLEASHDIFFESYNLATVKSIQAGAPIYSPGFYGDSPFIVTIYNPLYHWVVAALPQKASNPYFTGRLVSLVGAVFCASLLFLPGKFRRNVFVPFLAMGWLFLLHAPLRNTAYLRCDVLGILFSACAVVLVEKAESKPWKIVFGALLGLLAFMVKQNFLSGTITCFLYLFCFRRRDGLLFGGLSLVFYSSFLAYAHFAWGSGYWFSAYLSNLNSPRYLTQTISNWKEMCSEPLFVFLLLVTVLIVLHSLVKNKSQALRSSPYLLYVSVSLLILMGTLGKFGSDTNYFLEFILASLLWQVSFVRKVGLDFVPRSVTLSLLIVFCGLSAMEFQTSERHSYSFTDKQKTAHQQAVLELAKKEIKELKPISNRFLALNTWVNLYTLQPEAYLNDPINYWLMWNTGELDIGPLLRSIERKEFSLILMVSQENPYGILAMNYIPDGKPLRSLMERLNEHYTLGKKGVFLYLLPKSK